MAMRLRNAERRISEEQRRTEATKGYLVNVLCFLAEGRGGVDEALDLVNIQSDRENPKKLMIAQLHRRGGSYM